MWQPADGARGNNTVGNRNAGRAVASIRQVSQPVDEGSNYSYLRDAAHEKYSRARRSCIPEVADSSFLA